MLAPEVIMCCSHGFCCLCAPYSVIGSSASTNLKNVMYMIGQMKMFNLKNDRNDGVMIHTHNPQMPIQKVVLSILVMPIFLYSHTQVSSRVSMSVPSSTAPIGNVLRLMFIRKYFVVPNPIRLNISYTIMDIRRAIPNTIAMLRLQIRMR